MSNPRKDKTDAERKALQDAFLKKRLEDERFYGGETGRFYFEPVNRAKTDEDRQFVPSEGDGSVESTVKGDLKKDLYTVYSERRSIEIYYDFDDNEGKGNFSFNKAPPHSKDDYKDLIKFALVGDPAKGVKLKFPKQTDFHEIDLDEVVKFLEAANELGVRATLDDDIWKKVNTKYDGVRGENKLQEKVKQLYELNKTLTSGDEMDMLEMETKHTHRQNNLNKAVEKLEEARNELQIALNEVPLNLEEVEEKRKGFDKAKGQVKKAKDAILEGIKNIKDKDIGPEDAPINEKNYLDRYEQTGEVLAQKNIDFNSDRLDDYLSNLDKEIKRMEILTYTPSKIDEEYGKVTNQINEMQDKIDDIRNRLGEIRNTYYDLTTDGSPPMPKDVEDEEKRLIEELRTLTTKESEIQNKFVEQHLLGSRQIGLQKQEVQNRINEINEEIRSRHVDGNLSEGQEARLLEERGRLETQRNELLSRQQELQQKERALGIRRSETFIETDTDIKSAKEILKEKREEQSKLKSLQTTLKDEKEKNIFIDFKKDIDKGIQNKRDELVEEAEERERARPAHPE